MDGPTVVDRGRGRQGLHRADISRAAQTGLTHRPLAETVEATLELAETTEAAGLSPSARRPCSKPGTAGSIPPVEGFDFVAPRTGPLSGRRRDGAREQRRLPDVHRGGADRLPAPRSTPGVTDMILARARRSTSEHRCAPATSSRSASGPAAVGTKSFQLEYQVRSGDTVAAEAKTVIVVLRLQDRPLRRAAGDLEGGARRLMPVFERQTLLQRPAASDRADRPRAVGLLLHHARGRLALREPRTPAGSPTSPSTCSSRAPSAARPRATSRQRDRRHRRRVQRVHGQGVHGLLRALRGRAPRRSRFDVLVDMLRHSKFDPEEIDREKGVIIEEMNMYFDTPRDYISGVYDCTPLRRPAARLGHHRAQGDRSAGATRDTFTSTTSTSGTSPSAWSSGVGRQARRRPAGGHRAAPRRPRAGRDGHSGSCAVRGQRRRAGSRSTRRRPTRRTSSLGVPSYPLDHPDRYALQLLSTVPRDWHVVAALHRGSRAPRPRVLHLRDQPQLHRRRARSSRRPASTSSGSTRRSRRSSTS